MKEYLYIIKQAIQAGLIVSTLTIFFVFIGFEVLSMGWTVTYDLMIMLFTLLVFTFFGIIGLFAYSEYKNEFKQKTNESN